ncbi:MAG TPA: glycoside hydrolase family 43 protein, partial [Rubrobacter sp.]|nr:glycoside hydrolase family 43 protein [Rubrobacter sp.]
GLEERGSSAPTQHRTFENPVYDANFPDPFVLREGDTYHAYSTNDADANVPTLRSGDLVGWSKGGDAMPELAPWVTPGKTWAPEVMSREGGYVLYYTAASTAEGVQCVGRAAGDSPEGPFVDRDERPFVCQPDEGGSIDASPFVDEDGTPYLLWKNDGNAVGRDTYIYAQKMSPDGQDLVGNPVRLFKQGATWEGELVEAPVLWERDGEYYLFYSANAYYNESYAVGYARCEGPLGPCEKTPENPILRTGEGAVGPGHVAVIEDGTGQTWVAYHAWPPDAVGSVYPGRTLRLDRLTWKRGKPTIEGPTDARQRAPAPL